MGAHYTWLANHPFKSLHGENAGIIALRTSFSRIKMRHKSDPVAVPGDPGFTTFFQPTSQNSICLRECVTPP